MLFQTEVNDNDTNSQPVTSPISTIPENHIAQKLCKPPLASATLTTTLLLPSTLSKSINQRTISTPLPEDSDSTNNSLASSSGIGGSRDCSGPGIEEENSLTSFEGILQNGAPSSLDIDALQNDDSSKDSSSTNSKPMQTMMLADLLERKVDKEPIINGVLSKNSLNEKDPLENHIKKVLKDTTETKLNSENNIPQAEVSEDTLIEAPRAIKRTSPSVEENGPKKQLKYSNGTTSPEVESTVSSLKSEDTDDDKATVSSTAANLYAALAADCIDDEADLDEPIKIEPPQIKEEPRFINQIDQNITTTQPQQLIVAAPRQIVVQQAIQTSNNQVIIPGAQVKARAASSQPQVLLQQSAGGQLQYVVSGGVPGQNYVLAQSQTALVQGQAQTVLVAQTTQQQGTGAKTIIILQPQTTAQGNTQKVVAVTPQGQQVVVTQVPRPIIQSSALGNIPPPLVPTSAGIQQGSIIVSSSMAQTNSSTMTVIPAITQSQQVSVPARVVTPTPASTPPPTRPTTPHQAATTNIKQGVKAIVKASSINTNIITEIENKPGTSAGSDSKTITIKIDPNAYLCEWRGCLRQFKTAHEVYLHVCEAHCPTGGEEILCLWASCDGLKRRRFSLMTHLYDRHCNAEVSNYQKKNFPL